LLEKEIENIKNLILLKLICFGLVFAALSFMLPAFSKEKQASKSALNNAQVLLNNIQAKVYHLKQNTDEIIKAENYYSEVLKEAANSSCIQRIKLLNSLKEIGLSFNLYPNFNVRVSTPVLDTSYTKGEQWVAVKFNDINVNFAAKDLLSFLEIAEEIFNSLPQYKEIESLEINRNNILSFENLDKVKTGLQPKFTNGELNIRFNSIKVDKNKIFEQKNKN
jgi:competence protein ComGC